MLLRAICILSFTLNILPLWTFGQERHTYVIEIEPGDRLGQIVEKINSRNNILIAYPSYLSEVRPSQNGMIKFETFAELFGTAFEANLEVQQLQNNRLLLRNQDLSVQHGQQMIKGVIMNQNGVPLPDILISDKSRLLGMSDKNGEFEIAIGSNSSARIHFDALGYQHFSLTLSEVIEDPIVKISSQPIYLDPVTVVDQIPTQQINNKALLTTSRQTKSLPYYLSASPGQDPLRVLQVQPGIAATDDFNAGIKIRGSTAGQSLIVADNIPIYKADHFYGIFSSINGAYFNSTSLYKNALPIEYSGKIGGLVKLSSGRNIRESQARIYSDFLLSSLVVKTPVFNNSNLQLGVRSSYPKSGTPLHFNLPELNVSNYRDQSSDANSSTVITPRPNFWFYDANAQWKSKLKNADIAINAFTSRDDLNNNYTMNLDVDGPVKREHNQEFINKNDWQNWGASLLVDYHIDSNRTLTFTSYVSSFQENDSIFSEYNISRLQTQIQRFSVSNFQHNRIRTLGQQLMALTKNTNSQTKKGLEFKAHKIRYEISDNDRKVRTRNNQTSELAAFLERQWHWKKNQVILGSRATYYTTSGAIYFDPKVQYLWQPNHSFSIKSSMHYVHQYVRELNYENRFSQTNNIWLLANKNIPVGTSLQFMLGTTILHNNWKFDTEIYHKSLDSTLEFSLLMPGITNSSFPNQAMYALFIGEGSVMGADIYIEKRIKNMQSGIAYTLSKSTRNYPGIRKNLPFAAEDDRRHQLKWHSTYTIGSFTLFVDYIYSSGKPYLTLDQLNAEINKQNFNPQDFLTYLPSYQRMDIGVNFGFKIGKYQAVLGASCFNITNHQNVRYLQQIFRVPLGKEGNRNINTIIGAETALLDRTPNLSFTLDL